MLPDPVDSESDRKNKEHRKAISPEPDGPRAEKQQRRLSQKMAADSGYPLAGDLSLQFWRISGVLAGRGAEINKEQGRSEIGDFDQAAVYFG